MSSEAGCEDINIESDESVYMIAANWQRTVKLTWDNLMCVFVIPVIYKIARQL